MTDDSILIRNAMVMTLDAGDAILPRADILIRGNRIESIGAVAPEIAARAGRVIEADGHLAVPGLVNAHMHSQSGTMSGFGDRLSHPVFMWLTQAHTSRRTQDEIRLAVLLCAAQMLASGTTAVIDHFPGQRFSLADMDAVMAAWAETGMRTTLAMRFFDGAFGDILPRGIAWPPELAAAVRAVEILKPHPLPELREQMPDIVTRWHGHAGRLQAFPAPSNPDRCSDEALMFCAELAERHDLGIHTHLLETQAQAAIAATRYGTTTVAHLEALGILSGRWSCAHSIWIDDADIALMAKRQVVAVHNPESNARLGTGRMRTPDMLAAGIPIALGTDGSGANDNLIMQEAMRSAALLHRADLPDRRTWVSARDTLRMGTQGGAKAMRLEGQIGALAPGMLADLVLYRLDAPWWRPVNDPVSQLVFAETGAAVALTMVDGRILVEAGMVTAFDATGALSEIESMVASLRRRNADLFAVAEAIAREASLMTSGMVDLVIANAILVTPDGMTPGAVAIDGGRIVATGRDAAMPPARRVIDAGGRHVLPGAIDVHVHIREPGFSHKETWASATAAAAIGGVTTVLDMPNTNPPTATAQAVAQKIALASPQTLIDFGVYGYIGEDNIAELAPMARAGASAFKLYLGSDNPLVPCPNDGAVLDAMAEIAKLGRRVTVHAENTGILRWREAQIRAAGRDDLQAHLDQHADIATVEAVSRIALFSEWTGCPVHIAHESCRHSLPLIADAKRRGVDLTAETCPHYLFLSMDDAARAGGNALRVKPPVREAGHAGPLFEALASGLIDMISTDHAPHLPDEKRQGSIWRTAPGFPGVETSMRLMLTQVAAGAITLPDYVRMACEAPARAFGLYPRKGSLLPGTDADIVIVDMTATGVIRGEDLHSIGNVTPFEGMATTGRAVMTLVRGHVVAEAGRIVAEHGWGRALSVPA